MLARPEIEARLISDMNGANERYERARSEFDTLVARFPHDLPDLDGAHLIRESGNLLTIARQEFTAALIRYSDFMSRGIVPEDLRD